MSNQDAEARERLIRLLRETAKAYDDRDLQGLAELLTHSANELEDAERTIHGLRKQLGYDDIPEWLEVQA
jgi:hypothetical protein